MARGLEGAAAKTCIDCGPEVGPKPLKDFYRVRVGSDVRQSRCKACDNRRRAERERQHLLAVPRRPTNQETRVDVLRAADGSLTMVRRAR